MRTHSKSRQAALRAGLVAASILGGAFKAANAGPTTPANFATTFAPVGAQRANIAQQVVLLSIMRRLFPSIRDQLTAIGVAAVIDKIVKHVPREKAHHVFCAILGSAHLKTAASEVLKPETRVQIAAALAELKKLADCEASQMAPGSPSESR